MDNGDKENASPNKNKGARKALGPRWSTPASLPNMMFGGGGGDQSMLNPETPSKSLLGTDTSSSMLFSPPSILKETLPEEAAGHNPLLPAVPQQDETSPTSKLDVRWNMIACGKTRPSIEMTEHARRASISLESNPDPSTCRQQRLFLNCRASTEALQQRCNASSSLRIGFEPVSCHSPSNT